MALALFGVINIEKSLLFFHSPILISFFFSIHPVLRNQSCVIVTYLLLQSFRISKQQKNILEKRICATLQELPY